jgi:type IV pilus assembly protein PilA
VLARRLRGNRADEGFTLIELLVVIVIIGILAAIAIPIFMSQRSKGFDSQAKSDLRNFATYEEDYLLETGGYGTGAAVMASPSSQGYKHNAQVAIKVVSYEGTKGYCLSAHQTASLNTYFYDSVAGGLQAQNVTCPTTYATADGVALP